MIKEKEEAIKAHEEAMMKSKEKLKAQILGALRNAIKTIAIAVWVSMS